MKKITKTVKCGWGVCLTVLFITVTAVYCIIMGENIYFQPIDMLDSNITWLKMLKDSNLFWAVDAKVPFLGGMDRNYLYSEFHVYTWLYMLFPPLTAIIIGWIIKILMSIGGFVFLAKTIYDEDKDINVYVICGLLYGILPTFPTSAFGFASLPFLLAIMIRMYRRWDWRYLILLLVYPVLSDFSVFGLFICGYMVLFFIIDWIVTKRPKWQFIGGMFATTLGFVAVEWRLFYVMLFSNVETIRSDFEADYWNAGEAFKEFLNALVKGQEYSIHTYVVLPVCLIFLVYLNTGYIKGRNYKGLRSDPFNWIILWQVFNCALYSLDNVKWFKDLVELILPPLKGFAFNRTMWFAPLLWYVLFMMVLCRISVKEIWKFLVCIAAFIPIFVYPARYNHFFNNSLLAVESIIGEDRFEAVIGHKPSFLSYGEFYSEELFTKIKEDIGYKGEWSVAYGMHPGILDYNEIATLDGYLSYYPQEYKDRFRKLIAPELEVDPVSEEYFDGWGGRAYIFSRDTVSRSYWSIDDDESEMLIDPSVFREMGGKYVFSRVLVSNADELSLHLVKKYTDENSPYAIYLYSSDF